MEINWYGVLTYVIIIIVVVSLSHYFAFVLPNRGKRTEGKEMSKIKLPQYDGELPTMVVSGFIGAALDGKLVEQRSELYCPEEISEIVNFYLEKAYNKGVEDMRASVQDLLFEVQSNNYEYSLDYSYNHFKRDKENEQRKREASK